jgi:exosortase/archaeosortase family protein
VTSIPTTGDGRKARTALIQVLVLVALALAVFWSQLGNMASHVVTDFEAVHALALPVLILLVFLQRRRLLAESVTGNTWAGMAIVLGGLFMLAAAIWPFNYGYARWLALIPVIAGLIVVAAGWRGLWRSIPFLALLLVAIPVPARIYAFLIIRAETLTMETVAMLLDFLPGVLIHLDGQDFSYTRNGVEGTFALGEPHRGATIIMAYLMIGVFVTFMRVRPLWQIVALALASAPILIICNGVRLTIWGAFAIFSGSHPLSQAPRLLATVAALILAYVLFGAFARLLGHVIAEGDGAATARASTGC